MECELTLRLERVVDFYRGKVVGIVANGFESDTDKHVVKPLATITSIQERLNRLHGDVAAAEHEFAREVYHGIGFRIVHRLPSAYGRNGGGENLECILLTVL